MASPAAELVAFLARAIVTNPDAIRVRETEGGRLLELETAPDDRGVITSYSIHYTKLYDNARLPQTLTALAGTGILFTVLALPAMVSLDNLNSSGGDASVPALLLLVLIFWNLAVIVHIMRQALVVPLGTASYNFV